MTPPILYPRHIAPRIAEAMQDTPVVLIAGPRQAGKTTLARQLGSPNMRYLTLDDATTLMSSQADPAGLIRSLDRAVIDEIQRAPELLLAIKKSVDEDRRPGRFLLTGSANLMTLPAVADSLAGRMETVSLLPLSQGEIEGRNANWLDGVFAGQPPAPSWSQEGPPLVERVLRGGYPEALARPTTRRRVTWARQYIEAIIQRDIRDLAGVDRLDELPRLLRAVAQTAGQMCNYAQLAAQIGIDAKTAARYLGLFEQMYLLRRVDTWARNRLNRVVKSPKLQFIDSGLLAALQDLSPDEVMRDRTRLGLVLESFVFGELLKHAACAEGDFQILYYRDADKVEVDFVIEDAAGNLVGVEVKAAATVREGDLKGLRKLAQLAGDRLKMGIILYDGSEALPMGANLWVLPLATLWGGPLQPHGL
jgi:predicted AAA+ superfamily ATPase